MKSCKNSIQNIKQALRVLLGTLNNLWWGEKQILILLGKAFLLGKTFGQSYLNILLLTFPPMQHFQIWFTLAQKINDS